MVDPCPVEWMLGIPEKEVDICTVLRGIYHNTNDESIRIRARIATTMAKKLDMQLREYRKMFFATKE
jgi:hypothetical protein